MGRISDLTSHAGDGHLAVLKRLTQRFQHIAVELGQLVQKQHAPVRQRDLARQGQPPRGARAAGDRIGGGVMVRRAERAFGALHCFLSAADRRPDADDLEPFAVRQRRQDGGEALGHNALARSRRAGKQDIVSARSGDFERALDGVLSHHMGKIQLTVVSSGTGGGGQGESAARPIRCAVNSFSPVTGSTVMPAA